MRTKKKLENLNHRREGKIKKGNMVSARSVQKFPSFLFIKEVVCFIRYIASDFWKRKFCEL